MKDGEVDAALDALAKLPPEVIVGVATQALANTGSRVRVRFDVLPDVGCTCGLAYGRMVDTAKICSYCSDGVGTRREVKGDPAAGVEFISRREAQNRYTGG